MPSPNLNLPDLPASTNQPEVIVNLIRDLLDLAITDLIGFTITSSNALTVTNTEFRENFVFDINPDGGDPPTGQITVTVPNIERGTFAIKNDTLQNVLVTISGQADPAPVISVGQMALVVTTGANVRALEAGVADYLSLTDTPASYVGQKGKTAIVNDAENAMSFGVSLTPQLSSSSFKHSFQGAIVRRSGNLTISDATGTIVPFQTLVRDTLFTNDKGVTNQKFWLGPDLTFTVNAGTDEATATAHAMTTGDGPIQVSSTVTLPAGLAASTNYWVINVSANVFKFASSRANAIAGTAVDITDTGTGTHTINREEKLIIPEGVTRIKLNTGIRWDNVAVGSRQVTFFKNNSSVYDGRAEDVIPGESTFDQARSVESPVIDVVLGDWFTVRVFQNSGGNVDIVNSETTFFSIEVVESDIVVPFPQVMVEKPFSGAIAILTSTQSPPALFPTGVSWDSTSYDTGFNGVNFFSGGSPTRLTVPSGVTKVRVGGLITVNTGYTADNRLGCFIQKNSSTGFAGVPVHEMDAGGVGPDVSVTSGVIEVIGGDFFELVIVAEDLTFDLGTRSWFGIEVVESTQVLTFPGVTVYRPNIGALVNKTDANQSIIADTVTQITWNNSVYDTGFKGVNLFDNANDEFLIPAGVTKVRLNAGIEADNVVGQSVSLFFLKNDVAFPGSATSDHGESSGGEFLSITSPVIEVTAGDTIQASVFFDLAGNVINDANETYFAIEVVETTDDAFPPEQVETALLADGAALATSHIEYKKVAVRRFSLNDEFLNSRAHAGTAPTVTAQVFDVKKNGTIIGTVTFAVASQTATFTTTGSTQEDFDPGDRLTIETQGTVNTVIRDIVISLFAFRT